MDFSGSGVTYAFLIIPSLFALVVVVQGFEKVSKSEPDGWVGVGFGIFFMMLIAAAYFMFIQ